jgi:CheY-like chemotaxis protein
MYVPFNIVAIIDDDHICQFISDKVIEHSGIAHTVLKFYNGKEALLFFKSHLEAADQLPRLILLDLNMPVVNGWEFLDQFKDFHFPGDYRPLIYIFSSSSHTEDIQKSKEYPIITGYIVKPLTEHSIQKIMADLQALHQ